ncbi:MAG TPA: hypothetical protein VHW26_11330 [Solirubrobacteraceae bacterium]|nr:hypothetical protein [Solirubrobacteraceae bacterium]
MRRRPRLLAAAAAVVVLGGGVLAVVLLTGGSGHPSGGVKVNLTGIAGNVAPGASAALIVPRAAPAGARRLQVMLPAPLIHPRPAAGPLATDATTAAVYAGAGWRGTMIASIAAVDVPALTQFVTTDKSGGQAPGASFYLDGTVRLTPGQKLPVLPMLDKVGPAAERRQLDENIRTLVRGLPRRSVIRASVTRIAVDPAVGGMAYSVALRVRDLRRLTHHFGDIFIGLGTGLAPGPDSTVEGLAIHAEDVAGRTAGSWIATRAEQGTTVIDPHLHVPRMLVPRLHFVDETGGPRPLPSATAGPVT